MVIRRYTQLDSLSVFVCVQSSCTGYGIRLANQSAVIPPCPDHQITEFRQMTVWVTVVDPSHISPFTLSLSTYTQSPRHRDAEGFWPEANWRSFDFGRSNQIETGSIPAKTGRIFAHFTGSRLSHRQSASLVGREGEVSGESRGSSGVFRLKA